MMRPLLLPLLRLIWRWQILRAIFLSMSYGCVLALCLWIAYQLRFDFKVPPLADADLLAIGALTVGIQLLGLFAFHQFDGLLTYFSTPDLKRLVGACTSSSLVLGGIWLWGGLAFAPPRGVIVMDCVLAIGALSATRFVFRYGRLMLADRVGEKRKSRRVGIVGAGDTGAALARDLLAKPWLGLRPVAFFDDHRRAQSSVHGISLVGRPERIGELSRWLRLDEVIIAMPSAPPKRIRDVVQLIREAGLPFRTVPALDQLATGRVNVSVLRPVEIQDLLGRAPVQIEVASVWRSLRGRTVMVTGAGGSIGSELCRQILTFGPDKLLLVERSEPQLFAIEQELRAIVAGDVVEALMGDVTRAARMEEILLRFQPDVIFHAAAHKHVPMMEAQPEEAIRNNIFGTARLADLAVAHGVKDFVLISTDKAVNPTNVMGATKRVAELYLQSLAAEQRGTRFLAVRFGNVLGSSGSVVPTFARQIAEGGPVTVTHPEITRFFMTIPEAVTLVLQSSVFGQSGEIHVLDMGHPVKIADLAAQMIELSGFTPHQDIEIVFTGLRPGEKLYEELSHGNESVAPTKHPKIARLLAPPLPRSDFKEFLADLADAVEDGVLDPATLKALLAMMVPEYTPFYPSAPAFSPPVCRHRVAGTPGMSNPNTMNRGSDTHTCESSFTVPDPPAEPLPAPSIFRTVAEPSGVAPRQS